MDKIGYAIVDSNFSRLDNTTYLNSNDALKAANDYIMNKGYNKSNIHIHYGYTLNPPEYVTEDSDKKWILASINEDIDELTDSYKLKHIPKEHYQKKKKILTDKKKLLKANKLLWSEV